MADRTMDHFEQVLALAAHERMLAIGGHRHSLTAGNPAPSEVTLFDMGTGKLVRKVTVPTTVQALVFVAADRLIAGGRDGQLWLVDVQSGAPLASWIAHPGGVTALAVESGVLASTGVDGSIVLWAQLAAKDDEPLGVAEKTPGRAAKSGGLMQGLRSWLSGITKTAPASRESEPPGTSGAAGWVSQWTGQAPVAQRAIALDPAQQRVAAAGDDGVIRVYGLGDGPAREMAGHRGRVNALAFTPRDGRLASTGDDGTVRFWYLEGAIECEVRGEGDTGHAGGATALAFLPSPASDARDGSDRVMTTGVDGKIRTFRLDDKKRSKTYDAAGVQRAITGVTSDARKGIFHLVTGGDKRRLTIITLTTDGQLPDTTTVGVDGFAVLTQQIGQAQRAAKEALAAKIAAIAEPEAIGLLKQLGTDRETSVRNQVAAALKVHPRRDALSLTRTLVHDKDAGVGQTALRALVAIEDAPVAAWHLGLDAPAPAVRVAAIEALPPFYPANPMVPTWLAARLKDSASQVRDAALNALERVYPEGVEAAALAFDKGTADVRIEVMVRALLRRQLAPLQSITGRGLDDEDANVRQMAFTVRVLERPALARVLQSSLPLAEVFRRANQGKDPKPVELEAIRVQLGLSEQVAAVVSADDLAPLVVAMSAKATDIASRGAAGLLIAANDLRAISALLQLSRDEDSAVRLWVARALTGVDEPRAVQRLRSLLNDEAATVRAAAADGLTKTTHTALTHAALLLASAFEDMRKRGLAALVSLKAPQRNSEAQALLGRALDDEAASVRSEAFKTLWAWNPDTMPAAIEQAMGARFADLRLAAVRQLGVIAKAPANDDDPPPKNLPEWVLEPLELAIEDRDASVGVEAQTLLSRLLGPAAAKPWLLGLGSPASGTRLVAARQASRLARQADAASLRDPLTRALMDLSIPVRLAALDSVDALVRDEVGPLTAGLANDSLEVRVRAAELLAKRGDDRLIEPMRALVLDKDLALRYPAGFLEPLRERATGAMATLGSLRSAGVFADPLLKDDNAGVREQAARGLCNAGHPQFLLDALAHSDVAVRSWAAEGLARLGDDRGLAVLIGTLKDPHLPIREGALRALVALGRAGDSALLLGLDDADSYVSDSFFAILLARDLRAAREGMEPELLTAALAAGRVDVRFAAARVIELRADRSAYTQLLIEAVSPARPERAGDMKEWPAETERDRLAMQLLQMLAADMPQARYSAGQALLLRRKPLAFFAEVKRVVAMRPANETAVPDTDPRARSANDAVARRDWLRQLFTGASKVKASAASDAHRWIAFGAYVGLLRLASPDETVRRIRRDVVGRMVALADLSSTGAATPAAAGGVIAPASVVPALVRALDDDDHLVRKAAWSGVNTLLAATPDVAIRYGLASNSADIGSAALEQIAARGEAGRPWLIAALAAPVQEVRQQAFVLLERAAGPGSLDALMAAMNSPHSDIRLGVLRKLAASRDARVPATLRKALESDRDDVRLLAAQLLAERHDDASVPVLATWLRLEDVNLPAARDALAVCATEAAALALAQHLVALLEPDVVSEPGPLLTAKVEAIAQLGATRQPKALPALLAALEDATASVRMAAFRAGLMLANHRRLPEGVRVLPADLAREERQRPRWGAGVLQVLTQAAESRDTALRLAAAQELDIGHEPDHDARLIELFADRDTPTRVQAVASYALRVKYRQAAPQPLAQVVSQGTRELMLGAGEGLADAKDPAALRPLLLIARAGQLEEQVRAVLALGRAQQVRALAEVEVLANGGTDDAPADPLVRAAAIEALGGLYRVLADGEDKRRVFDLVEAAAQEGQFRVAGVKGLWAIARPHPDAAPADARDARALSRLQALASASIAAPAEVRATALMALTDLADPTSVPVLRELMTETAWAEPAHTALQGIYPDDPLKVALIAATSSLPTIAGPALAYVLGEADPAPLIERLAEPGLDEALRTQLKFGLARRTDLPLSLLTRQRDLAAPQIRNDLTWLLGYHALANADLSADAKASHARAMAESVSEGIKNWALDGSGEATQERTEALVTGLWTGAVLGSDAQLIRAATDALVTPALDAPVRVRVQSLRTLASTTPATTVGAIAKQAAFSDTDAEVRRVAVAAMSQVNASAVVDWVEAVKPLDPIAFDRAPVDLARWNSPRHRHVMLPQVTTQPSAAEPLMRIAETSASEAEQLAALMALGRIGGESAIAFLARLAFSAGGGESGEDGDEGDDEDEDEDEDTDSGPSPDVSMPGARRFEFEEDDSRKFWEAVIQGNAVVVRFGRIGTLGQKRPKELASPEAAAKELQKLIREKTNKGYEEVKPRSAEPPKGVKETASVGARIELPEGMAPWGTPTLREAAYRALRRAQREAQRRQYRPTWFTAAQLDALAANPELAESMLPPTPPKRNRGDSEGGRWGNDDDDGDDDDYDDE
jgi:ParB family transcriptional regulator, chromosome partitioning protein